MKEAAVHVGVLGTLLLGTLAAGCFDVQTVASEPFVLDDFDDDDFQPSDPTFGPWHCYTYPDGSAMHRCDQAKGWNSDYSLFLSFTITDVPNGSQEYGGGALVTYASRPADFSTFSEIVFSDWIESGSPPLPSDALLYVEFGCSTAPDDKGKVPGDFYVVTTAEFHDYWETLRLTLDSFGQPSWQARAIQGGTAGCLQRVDSVRFSVSAQLPDGQTGQATLHIDGISLQ